MPTLAANPAASPHLSLGLTMTALRGLMTGNGGGQWPSCRRSANRSNPAAIARNFRSQSTNENSGLTWLLRYVSRLVLGHCFGAIPAPYGSSLFCFGCAALRVTVSVPDPP